MVPWTSSALRVTGKKKIMKDLTSVLHLVSEIKHFRVWDKVLLFNGDKKHVHFALKKKRKKKKKKKEKKKREVLCIQWTGVKRLRERPIVSNRIWKDMPLI